MPNIRQQIVGALGDKAPSLLPDDDFGLYIMSSNGKAVTITKRAILAHALLETPASQRKSKTIAWVKTQIEAALGMEMFDQTKCSIDYDPVDKKIWTLEMSS